MYTILINDDKSLTTSVRTTLLRHSTTDEIQILYDPHIPEDDPDDGIEKTYVFSAILYYQGDDHVIKSESVVTDEEMYKGRVRFYIPASSTFFNNRGRFKIWLSVTTEITTTTTTETVDETTGEITTDTTTETESYTASTMVTDLFIEEIPRTFPGHSSNVIRITRGDSLEVTVTLTDDDGFPYEPVEGDEIWFRVKKSAIAEDILIEKSVDPTNLIVQIEEADTKNLEFGNYKYEIEVVCASGDHYTVIKNAPFIITEELH